MTGSSITFTLLLKVIPVLWKQTGIRVVELGRVPLILTPSECKIWVGYPGGNMEEVFTSCQPGLLQLRWCHVLFLKKSLRFYVTPVPRQKPISSLWELLVFSLGKKLQSDHRTSFRWESLMSLSFAGEQEVLAVGVFSPSQYCTLNIFSAQGKVA